MRDYILQASAKKKKKKAWREWEEVNILVHGLILVL